MPRFRGRPVDAIRYDGDNRAEIAAFLGDQQARVKTRMLPGPGRGMRVGIEIRTLAGRLTAAVGDWIIRNARGGIATCRHKDFTEVYEPDDEPGETPRAG